MEPQFQNNLGKFLLLLGVAIALIGLFVTYRIQIPFLGKLPGDIHIKRENFQFYFPLTTSLLLSVLLTVILSLFRR